MLKVKCAEGRQAKSIQSFSKRAFKCHNCDIKQHMAAAVMKTGASAQKRIAGGAASAGVGA